MMSWLLGHKRNDRSDEIEQIKAQTVKEVEGVKVKRLALEEVVERMKRDRADAMGK